MAKSTQKRLCKERLWKEEWSKIPLSVFSNLVKYYRRRLSSVLLAKGGLYKVLTSGVPINVAHMISCKKKNVSPFFLHCGSILFKKKIQFPKNTS